MSESRFNPDGLVLAERYAQTMNEVVLPWLAARRRDVTVNGEGGVPLFASRFDAPAPQGTVMIVQGFTECVEKFAELIHSLLRNGYSVVAYDQRGHGRSRRDPAIADISLTHVDRFGDYVRDMRQVCAQVLEDMPKSWLLFAHSMGGAVSALFLEQHPGVFTKAALCAPMIAANLGGLPPAVAKLLCGAQTLLKRDRRRVFISRPYAGPEDFDTSCASGRERFDWYEALRLATPAFQNNGPSYGWTREAIRASEEVLAPGAVEKIGIPVRVFTAEDDNSVMPDAQKTFVGRLMNGERIFVPGSRHEIYRSGDAVLFPWWRGILAFFGE